MTMGFIIIFAPCLFSAGARCASGYFYFSLCAITFADDQLLANAAAQDI